MGLETQQFEPSENGSASRGVFTPHHAHPAQRQIHSYIQYPGLRGEACLDRPDAGAAMNGWNRQDKLPSTVSETRRGFLDKPKGCRVAGAARHRRFLPGRTDLTDAHSPRSAGQGETGPRPS